MRLKKYLCLTIASALLFMCTPVYAAETNVATVTSGNDSSSYTSFSDAWHKVTELASSDDVTITLLADYKGNGSLGSGDGFKNGAIYCSNKHVVTIDLNGHTINRNLSKAKGNGEVMYVASTLTITDSSPDSSSLDNISGGVITGGYNDDNGGGIIIADNGILNFNGGTLYKCITDEKGGGIALTGSKAVLNVDGGSFLNNRANDNFWRECEGGAIYNDQATVNISNAVFKGNYAEDDGGVIYSYGGKLTVDHADFNGNYAKEEGIIFFKNNAKCIFSNCTFTGNTSVDNGGVFYCDDGTLSLTDSTFTSNKVTNGSGGALYIDSGCQTDIRRCTFEKNTASNHGGALYLNSSDSTKLYELTMKDNSCSKSGGAAYVNGDAVYFVDLNCSGNTAKKYGGGIYVDSMYDMNAAGKVIVEKNTVNNKQNDLCLQNGTFTTAYLYSGGLAEGSSIYLCSTDSSARLAIKDILDVQYNNYIHFDSGYKLSKIDKTTLNESNIRAVGSVLGMGNMISIIILLTIAVIIIGIIYFMRKGKTYEVK